MCKPDVKYYQFKCISIENKEEEEKEKKNKGKELHGSVVSLLCPG